MSETKAENNTNTPEGSASGDMSENMPCVGESHSARGETTSSVNKTDMGDLERKIISESDYESDGSLEYTMDDILDNISEEENEKGVNEMADNASELNRANGELKSTECEPEKRLNISDKLKGSDQVSDVVTNVLSGRTDDVGKVSPGQSRGSLDSGLPELTSGSFDSGLPENSAGSIESGSAENPMNSVERSPENPMNSMESGSSENPMNSVESGLLENFSGSVESSGSEHTTDNVVGHSQEELQRTMGNTTEEQLATVSAESRKPGKPIPSVDAMSPGQPKSNVGTVSAAQATGSVDSMPQARENGNVDVAEAEVRSKVDSPQISQGKSINLSPDPSVSNTKNMLPEQPIGNTEVLIPERAISNNDEVRPRADVDAVPSERPCDDVDAVPPEPPSADVDAVPPGRPCDDADAVPSGRPCDDADAVPSERPCDDVDAVPSERPCDDVDAVPSERPCDDVDAVLSERPSADVDAVPPEPPSADVDAVPPEPPSDDVDAVPPERPSADFNDPSSDCQSGDAEALERPSGDFNDLSPDRSSSDVEIPSVCPSCGVEEVPSQNSSIAVDSIPSEHPSGDTAMTPPEHRSDSVEESSERLDGNVPIMKSSDEAVDKITLPEPQQTTKENVPVEIQSRSLDKDITPEQERQTGHDNETGQCVDSPALSSHASDDVVVCGEETEGLAVSALTGTGSDAPPQKLSEDSVNIEGRDVSGKAKCEQLDDADYPEKNSNLCENVEDVSKSATELSKTGTSFHTPSDILQSAKAADDSHVPDSDVTVLRVIDSDLDIVRSQPQSGSPSELKTQNSDEVSCSETRTHEQNDVSKSGPRVSEEDDTSGDAISSDLQLVQSNNEPCRQPVTSTVEAETDTKPSATEAHTEIAKAKLSSLVVSASAVAFSGEGPDIYALEADSVLEVPSMNGNATFTRRKPNKDKKQFSDSERTDGADSSFQDSFDVSFSTVVDITISEESEPLVEEAPCDDEKVHESVTRPNTNEQQMETISETATELLDTTDLKASLVSDELSRGDQNTGEVSDNSRDAKSSPVSSALTISDELNNNNGAEISNVPEVENLQHDKDLNQNKSTESSCDNLDKTTQNVPLQRGFCDDQNVLVHNCALATIAEDTIDGHSVQPGHERSQSGESRDSGVPGTGVVMRKKARGGRTSRAAPSFADSATRQSVFTQDEILQQKIDFEIKMRDGTAKLLAASKHPSQLLEAAKSLLTSNTRMLNYMSELQRRKCQEVTPRKQSEEGSNDICKAKVCVSDHRRFAVFCMVRLGTQIYDTSLVKEVDSSMTDITFDDVINFNDVSADFELTVEVYSHKVNGDSAVASTPRKIKKKINEFSTSVGRRLSGLKEDHDQMSHMIVGPKFEKIAEATLSLNDVSDTVSTYDLDIHDPPTDKDAHHNELPLFGNLCCKIAAQPDCMLKEIISSQLGVRRHKESEMTFYWAMLKDQLLSFYSTPAQCHSNKTAALSIPVNKSTKLLETKIDGVEILEISNKTARVRTRYLLQGADGNSTQQWGKALHQHIANQESWQHACDIKVELSDSPPRRTSTFVQPRKPAASLYEETGQCEVSTDVERGEEGGCIVLPRKPAASLYEETELDSPMTRILNRLNIEPEEEEDMDTETPPGDDKENALAPSGGGPVHRATKSRPTTHKANKKNARSRQQTNV